MPEFKSTKMIQNANVIVRFGREDKTLRSSVLALGATLLLATGLHAPTASAQVQADAASGNMATSGQEADGLSATTTIRPTPHKISEAQFDDFESGRTVVALYVFDDSGAQSSVFANQVEKRRMDPAKLAEIHDEIQPPEYPVYSTIGEDDSTHPTTQVTGRVIGVIGLAPGYSPAPQAGAAEASLAGTVVESVAGPAPNHAGKGGLMRALKGLFNGSLGGRLSDRRAQTPTPAAADDQRNNMVTVAVHVGDGYYETYDIIQPASIELRRGQQVHLGTVNGGNTVVATPEPLGNAPSVNSPRTTHP